MLPTKARSCAHIWLVDNAKGQIGCKKSKIKAKQTEIKPKKGQTSTQHFLPHNN